MEDNNVIAKATISINGHPIDYKYIDDLSYRTGKSLHDDSGITGLNLTLKTQEASSIVEDIIAYDILNDIYMTISSTCQFSHTIERKTLLYFKEKEKYDDGTSLYIFASNKDK